MTADTETEPSPQAPEPPSTAPEPLDVTEPVEPPAPPREGLKGETERIEPEPLTLVPRTDEPLKLTSGTGIVIVPLKLRQFLAMLRIITRGATSALSMGALSSRDSEDFVRQLMAMLLFAIPEAEDETIAFIQSMVDPVGVTPKADKKGYAHAKSLLEEELDNPELEDIVTILEGVLYAEAEDLRALGNRLRSMFEVAQKMGLVPA